MLDHLPTPLCLTAQLESLDADIVGLNEVTSVFLKKAMATPWIRERYYLSVVLGSLSCKRLSTVRGGGSFGNLIMSKLPLDYVEYVNSGSGRHSHAAQFTLGSHKVKVCSTHLIAAPYINEGKRKRELQRLTASLGMHDGTVVIMGDFNFHREAENSSIPEGWSEVPAVVSLGTTWSFARNKMLAHYLPLRNLYNGLGLGASFGWPSEMRLDRLLIKGDNLDNDNAEARLFANEPIHERGKDRPALPQSGPELREKHRNMPWEEFLFPSDHFGIVVDIPAK